MRAYVDAQREYASRDRNGDQVLEYAQRLASTPGTKDGLYWPPDLDGEISPLGPMVAEAQGEGYRVERKGRTARASRSTAISSRSSPARASTLPGANTATSSTAT